MSVLGTILLILLSLIVILIVIILCLNIRVFVTFKKERDGKPVCFVKVALSGGTLLFEKNFGGEDDQHGKDEKETAKDEKETATDENFIAGVKRLYNSFLKIKYTYQKSKRKIRKSIKMEKLILKVNFGLDDAFKTGIATGSVWTGIYCVIAFLTNFMTITEPEVNVFPDFENSYVEAEGECILRLRVANIISMLGSIFINYYFINKKMTKKEKAAINYGSNSN